jgi:multiple sugar transport system substrate-binding protein
MQRRRIRQWVLTAVAVSAALAVTACSDTSASPKNAGPVTVTLWGTYGNGGNKTQTSVLDKTIIPAFEKAHPDIKIDYVDIPYDSLLQKLETSAAGGKLPDLIRSDVTWVPKFASLGVFARLDGTMSDFKTLAAGAYPGSLATNEWQGHYYGLPLDTNTRVLISNPAALEAAGLTAPPATVAQFTAMADTLAAKHIALFADSGLQGWDVLPWIWSAGGEITDPSMKKATGYLNGPASVSAVQTLVDLYRKGAISKLIIGDKGAVSTQDGLPKTKYATVLDGPWMPAIWAAQYPKFHPTYSPVPAGAGGSVSVVGGEDIVMTSSSPHQKQAEAFLRFTQSATYQLAMAKTGQMSVVKSLDSQESGLFPFYSAFIKQLQNAKARPAVPEEPQIDTVLQNSLVPAFQGKTTVRQALDNAARQIDPLLTATR